MLVPISYTVPTFPMSRIHQKLDPTESINDGCKGRSKVEMHIHGTAFIDTPLVPSNPHWHCKCCGYDNQAENKKICKQCLSPRQYSSASVDAHKQDAVYSYCLSPSQRIRHCYQAFMPTVTSLSPSRKPTLASTDKSTTCKLQSKRLKTP
eukprot:67745_1